MGHRFRNLIPRLFVDRLGCLRNGLVDAIAGMTPSLYRCPSTGMMVQGFCAADDGSDERGDVYIGVHCLACSRIHLINPKTGKVLGADTR